jgi:hypothetical protein
MMRTARSTGNDTEIRGGKVLFTTLVYAMYSGFLKMEPKLK